MSSPYTPPQSEDPVVVPHAAGAGDGLRTIVRMLGILAVLAAAMLANALGKLSSMLRELGIFDEVTSRLLVRLLVQFDGALPFLSAVSLAATGVILSFRSRAPALPMLAFVIASLLLTALGYFGMWFIIVEFVRATGGA